MQDKNPYIFHLTAIKWFVSITIKFKAFKVIDFDNLFSSKK
ncbi:hypothetical protein CLU83_1687 [Flavobacterium sp. 1]|nr:hypothetical protein CLU83_1687 [Flavobacterium sp. 1]